MSLHDYLVPVHLLTFPNSDAADAEMSDGVLMDVDEAEEPARGRSRARRPLEAQPEVSLLLNNDCHHF